MIEITLGNGDIGITQTVKPNNEISIEFSQLVDKGRLGEFIPLESGNPICKLNFGNIDGLDNLIKILNLLKKRVYKSNYFMKRCYLGPEIKMD